MSDVVSRGNNQELRIITSQRRGHLGGNNTWTDSLDMNSSVAIFLTKNSAEVSHVFLKQMMH